MSLEEFRNHVLYLKERDNSGVTKESFEKDMEILLKYIAELDNDNGG